MRIVCFCVWIAVASLATAPPAFAQQPPSGEFVPMDEVPPGEQLPALPLIATAYGFIWIALLGYVWSIGKRLKQVETEIGDLESRRK